MGVLAVVYLPNNILTSLLLTELFLEFVYSSFLMI